MKKVSALMLVLCFAAAPSLSFASDDWIFGDTTHKNSFYKFYKSDFDKKGNYGYVFDTNAFFQKKYKGYGKYQPLKPVVVPEISAGGAGLALSLMGGLVLIARERRRKNSA